MTNRPISYYGRQPSRQSILHLFPSLEAIAIELEQRVGSTYRAAIDTIAQRWLALGPTMTAAEASQVVRDVLGAWPTLTAAAYGHLMNGLFTTGFMIGVIDSGVTLGPDQGDSLALQWLSQRPDGFIRALDNLSKEGTTWIEDVISDAYAGVDKDYQQRSFDLDQMVKRVVERGDVGKKRAELIVRTETTNVTNGGRLAAWEHDPLNDWYWYDFIPTHDDRTKDVSLFFESRNPYTFSAMRRVWTVEHFQPVRVRNRHTGRMENQISAFNCRCTTARRPKPPEDLLREGKITRDQYDAEVGA